jgi:hypothetical protein
MAKLKVGITMSPASQLNVFSIRPPYLYESYLFFDYNAPRCLLAHYFHQVIIVETLVLK